MGRMKSKLMAEEDYYNIAKKILLEMGEIALCKKHPDETYFYQMYKYEEKAIYGLATNKLKEKYPDMTDFVTFHSQVEQVLNDADAKNNCPICQNDD